MKERWKERLEEDQAMTDLERARDLRRSLEAAIHPAMRDCFEQCVAHLLADARREGAEAERDAAYWRGLEAGKCAALMDYQIGKAEGAAEMRERAARTARYWTASQKIADVIRALPLTPEEPAKPLNVPPGGGIFSVAVEEPEEPDACPGCWLCKEEEPK